MTPKSSQKSKIGSHFCKMCTYDPLTPSSATPDLRYLGLAEVTQSWNALHLIHFFTCHYYTRVKGSSTYIVGVFLFFGSISFIQGWWHRLYFCGLSDSWIHQQRCHSSIVVTENWFLRLYWILCNSPKLDLPKGESNGPQSPLPQT